MAASLGAILILAIGNLYQWRLSSQPASPTPAYHFNVVAMVADDPAAEAEGVLVISPDGRYGTLVVDGLQPLVAGQEYQLWLIIGDSRVSGGVFSVSSSGYGALKVEAPRPLSEYNRFGITIEPVGGSPQPTGKRVLGSEL
jgi:anti-sigma-K factor RskA